MIESTSTPPPSRTRLARLMDWIFVLVGLAGPVTIFATESVLPHDRPQGPWGLAIMLAIGISVLLFLPWASKRWETAAITTAYTQDQNQRRKELSHKANHFAGLALLFYIFGIYWAVLLWPGILPDRPVAAVQVAALTMMWVFFAFRLVAARWLVHRRAA